MSVTVVVQDDDLFDTDEDLIPEPRVRFETIAPATYQAVCPDCLNLVEFRESTGCCLVRDAPLPHKCVVRWRIRPVPHVGDQMQLPLGFRGAA